MLTERLAPPPIPVSATIRTLLLQARHALASDLAAAEVCIEGAVQLLPEMDRPSAAEREPCFAPGGLAPWQVLRVRAYIEARLAQTLSAAELAAVARLSASHFARTFKRTFGDSPHVYVNRRRIARAKALMLETEDSLTSITFACGLADQAHFCRLFRRFESQSPSTWRRLHMQGRDHRGGQAGAAASKSPSPTGVIVRVEAAPAA